MINKAFTHHVAKSTAISVLGLMEQVYLNALQNITERVELKLPSGDELQTLIDKARIADINKQDGFYVSFDGAHFKTPSERIGGELLAEMVPTLLRHFVACRTMDIRWSADEGRELPADVSMMSVGYERLAADQAEITKAIED